MHRCRPLQVPLLPSVITPQLSFGSPPSHSHRPTPPKARSTRLLPLSPPQASARSPQAISPQAATKLSCLSVVNEDTESSSSEKTLTQSKTSLSQAGGTLKASSHSDFETDSLEAHGASGAAVGGETVRQQTGVHVSSPSVLSPLGLPTTAQATSPASNLVVTYAMQEGSVPLSPIWNQMQYLRTDSESSSNSEYITSYVGHGSPLPQILPPEPPYRRPGGDSGTL